MRCPDCGFDDPEDLAFCSECGRPRGPAARSSVAEAPGRGASFQSRFSPGALPTQVDAAPGGFPDSAPPARLVGVDGPLEGAEFILDRPELVIGRRPDCEIRVPENGVSRQHAWLRATADGFIIEDAGSANGTWVNDTRAEGPVLLAEGDIIRIGPCSFVFHDQQGFGLPPGSMTVVSDVGHDPSPFGGEPAFAHDLASERSPTPPFLPSPWPGATAEPVRRPEPVVPPAPAIPPAPVVPPPSAPPPPVAPPPAAPPASVAPPVPTPPRPDLQPVEALRGQLAELNRDLGDFVQRLDTLAESLTALEGRFPDSQGSARPGPLPQPIQELFDELAAAGGVDRYRDLQALLEELNKTPTDLRLLLRLSDQLPTMTTLVGVYLRALAALHDDRG